MKIEPWRLAIWKEIGFEPHPGQTRLFQAFQDYQYVEAEAGRGGGKSYLAARGLVFPEFIRDKWTTKHWWEWPRFILLVAPQQDQAEIIFQEVYALAKEWNIPLKRDRESGDIITEWGSRLRCMTGKNPTAMRGYAWNLVVIDELPYLDRGRYVVDSVLKGTIARRKGKMVLIGSPDAPGTFAHECALRGDNPGVPEWGHVHWTSIENWYIPWMLEFIESERRQGVPEDVIQREYFAKFTSHHGLVYSDYHACVMSPGEIEDVEKIIFSPSKADSGALVCNSNGEWARATDFGFTNPHACITHVRLGETIYAWDEYYRRRAITEVHAEQYARMDQVYDYELNVCDLAEPATIRSLAAYTYDFPGKGKKKLKGVWILKGTKPAITDRVQLMQSWMATGRYRIHPRCTEYISELAVERYPEGSEAKNVAELPVDANNHGSSGSGYYLWHLFGGKVLSKAIYRFGGERGKALTGYN